MRRFDLVNIMPFIIVTSIILAIITEFYTFGTFHLTSSAARAKQSARDTRAGIIIVSFLPPIAAHQIAR
jgi:hypothetical protein